MTTVSQKLTCPPIPGDTSTPHPSVAKRCRVERNMLFSLLTHLHQLGFEVTGASDGEERHKCTTILQALSVVFSVDDSAVYVRRAGDAKGHTICVILGNDGWDAVSDYSVAPGFTEAMDAFNFDVWDDRT